MRWCRSAWRLGLPHDWPTAAGSVAAWWMPATAPIEHPTQALLDMVRHSAAPAPGPPTSRPADRHRRRHPAASPGSHVPMCCCSTPGAHHPGSRRPCCPSGSSPGPAGPARTWTATPDGRGDAAGAGRRMHAASLPRRPTSTAALWAGRCSVGAPAGTCHRAASRTMNRAWRSPRRSPTGDPLGHRRAGRQWGERQDGGAAPAPRRGRRARRQGEWRPDHGARAAGGSAPWMGTRVRYSVVADGVVVERCCDTGYGTVLDADGLIALPGLVDLHTTSRAEGQGGCRDGGLRPRRQPWVALFGHSCMANTDPVADTAAWSSRSGNWASAPASSTSAWAPSARDQLGGRGARRGRSHGQLAGPGADLQR
jgi:hypothetical protein